MRVNPDTKKLEFFEGEEEKKNSSNKSTQKIDDLYKEILGDRGAEIRQKATKASTIPQTTEYTGYLNIPKEQMQGSYGKSSPEDKSYLIREDAPKSTKAHEVGHLVSIPVTPDLEYADNRWSVLATSIPSYYIQDFSSPKQISQIRKLQKIPNEISDQEILDYMSLLKDAMVSYTGVLKTPDDIKGYLDRILSPTERTADVFKIQSSLGSVRDSKTLELTPESFEQWMLKPDSTSMKARDRRIRQLLRNSPTYQRLFKQNVLDYTEIPSEKKWTG